MIKDELDRKIRDELESLIRRDTIGAISVKARGPNPSRTMKLYNHMPSIHEALTTSSQKDILLALEKAGVPTTRQTLARVYKKWTTDNKKTPNMKFGAKKKKPAEKAEALNRILRNVTGNKEQ